MIERDREELNEEVILLHLWKFKTPTLSKMYFSIFLTLLVKIELKIKLFSNSTECRNILANAV